MYQRNIDILEPFEEYDFLKPIPPRATAVKTEPRSKAQLNVRSIGVEVLPSHVFSFKNNSVDEVGLVWFVAQLHGFKDEELGIFVDLAHRYLRAEYGKSHIINPKNCIVIDVSSKKEVNYSQLLAGRIPSVLNATVNAFIDACGTRGI